MRFPRLALRLFVLAATAQLLLTPARAFGQFVVDCTGNTPGTYTTINSVLPFLSDGAVVRITGTCTENVHLPPLRNLWIGAPSGQTANLQGNLTINGVQNLFLYGLNISNSSWDGLDIMNSANITLDNCTSSNNSSAGLNAQGSVVSVEGPAAFNNNGNGGIQAGRSVDLSLGSYLGPGAITISNNVGDGIYLEDGIMFLWGGVTIANNKPSATYNSPGTDGAGFGINLWGHARGFLISSWSSSTVSGNQAGGIALHENSEFALTAAPASPDVPVSDIIDGNGSVGVSVGSSSQVSIWSGVQITNQTDAGVDVYQHSQAVIDSTSSGSPLQIAGNATGTASAKNTHAGIRVDGNSEAYIRGGQIIQNGGPGILVLANSSVDLSGATLTSNLGGPIECDSSAWLVTDQTSDHANLGAASPCRIPSTLGPVFRPDFGAFSRPPAPDDQLNAQNAKYRQLISSF